VVNKTKKAPLPKEVYILSVVAFFVAIGYGLIVPAIPLFAESFGVGNTAVGFIVSSFAFARFGSGLISGKLVDRFGERQVLGIGLLMVALSSLASGLATSYWHLLLFRAAGGLGSSMFSVSASALLMRSVHNDHRGRAQSTYNGGFLIGGMAGPAFGGALSAISLRIPFFVYSVTLLFASTTAFVFLNESRLGKSIKNEQDPADRILLREAIKLLPYRAALAIAFLSNWVLFGLRNSILPLFVQNELKSTTAVVGYGFTISAIAQAAFLLYSGKLSDLRGRKFVLKIGSTLLISAVFTLILASAPWYYFLAMALFGIGGAFIGTGHANVIGDIFGGRGGQVIAVWQMAGDAGMIIGPIVLGVLADVQSFRAAYIVSAVVFTYAIYLAFTMPETKDLTKN